MLSADRSTLRSALVCIFSLLPMNDTNWRGFLKCITNFTTWSMQCYFTNKFSPMTFAKKHLVLLLYLLWQEPITAFLCLNSYWKQQRLQRQTFNQWLSETMNKWMNTQQLFPHFWVTWFTLLVKHSIEESMPKKGHVTDVLQHIQSPLEEDARWSKIKYTREQLLLTCCVKMYSGEYNIVIVSEADELLHLSSTLFSVILWGFNHHSFLFLEATSLILGSE